MVTFADSVQLPGAWLGFYVVFLYRINGRSLFSVIWLGWGHFHRTCQRESTVDTVSKMRGT